MGEKMILTLENGEKVDCGVEQFNALKKSMKEQKPKEIAINTFRVLMSSKIMVNKLVENMDKMLSKINTNRNHNLECMTCGKYHSYDKRIKKCRFCGGKLKELKGVLS